MLSLKSFLSIKRCWFALVAATATSFYGLADSLPIHTQSIQAKPFHLEINRTGRVDFRYITNLSFKTPGYIQQLHAAEGQHVSQGEALGTIELTDLNAAQASAQATYEKAVQDAVRARKLYQEKKTVSKDFLEQAETALVQAKSERKRIEYDLAKARIEAPFNAVILERLMQPGEQAQAGTPVFSVAALSPDNLIVRLNLTQQEIAQIHVHDSVTITLTNQQRVEGSILTISATAAPRTGLYEVEIAMDLQQKQAFPGQWVQVQLHVSREQLAYRIPIIALAGVTNDKAQIMVQEKQGYQRLSFEILHIDQQAIYVPAATSSTQKSIQVVTQGWDRLLNQESQ